MLQFLIFAYFFTITRHCICKLIKMEKNVHIIYTIKKHHFGNIYTVSIKRRTDFKTRVPSDWESSPHTSDPNQATARALDDIKFIRGSTITVSCLLVRVLDPVASSQPDWKGSYLGRSGQRSPGKVFEI